MKVTVVIPGYNAGRFVQKAVESALEQPETAEVILVDDASKDDSAAICRELESRFPAVRFVTHRDGQNHGANITRNRGIEEASSEFVSFLDADDYYLPGRFAETRRVFESFPDADGVYEAIGTHSYDEESLKKHMDRMRSAAPDMSDLTLTTMKPGIAPDALCAALFSGVKGWVHLDGFTVRKSFINKAGAFDTDLRWNEDNELFFRLSFLGRLFPGILDRPVAMRGVHKDNFTLSDTGAEVTRHYNVIMFRKLFRFMLRHPMGKSISRVILWRYLDFYNHRFSKRPVTFYRKLVKLLHLIITVIRFPKVLTRVI